MPHNLLEIDNLTLKLDDKTILDGLTLDIWEHHTHAIMGINGAGKSTLANTIMGLNGYGEFSGEIRFLGKSLKGLGIDERARLGITLSWQEPARFEGLKVRDFIRSSARDKSDAAVQAALTTVGINPDRYLERAVDRTLSGGERKKVELASILAMKPRLALLDEPDSGIDIESIERIFNVVRLLREEGTTVVFITHSMAVLQQAEHAFLLCHGRLVDQGNVKKISRYFEGECMPCDVRDPEKKEKAI
ncbi:MAG TPA: ABC transporter ATP-binding protein [Candidatus Aminicenantes bacterium]|nr:ABC transporter ATP-binding protein [Candidatus Aminicenantes bacterium]